MSAELHIDTAIERREWKEPAPAPAVQTLTERQLAVILRVRELLKSRPRRASDVICIDERDWVYPKLARPIVQEQTAFATRTCVKCCNTHGLECVCGDGYNGLSDFDASRKFWRAMEKFCDRSNGIPGLPPWLHK